MLLRPREDFYTTAIPAPADVLLLVEVAVSSVEYDRNTKRPLYAQHCVPEVWLIDVLQRQLEASSEPVDQGYANFETHRAGLLAPCLLPDVKIQITRILARPA
jgi:Uma2 family endonuclease